jgi:hypothetical protein
MTLRPYIRPLLFACTIIMYSCGGPAPPSEAEMLALDQKPHIFPDYTGITIPVNIAPLNFEVTEEGEAFQALVEGEHGKSFSLKARKNTFRIPPAKWARLISSNQGSRISIRVFKKSNKQWSGFAPFHMQVAAEPIDPYLMYRLIPPGYETWSSMGLYQRDLTSFREKPVIENEPIEDNCVNCHSFSQGSSENMLFHIRGSMGGTMIKRGDLIEKIDLKRDETLSAGVYPAFHPSGDYIAFSTNRIEQYFHASPEESIEVLDRQSDLIIYNIDSKEVRHVPGTKGDRYMETYPNWSPDGTYLYFSRTGANAETSFDSIRYDIYRIGFDPDTEEFGETEAVFLASRQGKSASFPRISPDGKYLLCTLHDYGTFPIWHKEADLCLIDLSSGRTELPAMVNSEDTESYHSWSSNNRWIVFSSRRYDGRYTKPYISYLNNDGQFQKAFLLPQKDPRSNQSFFYSYNRPELITGPIEVNPRQWIRKAREN